MVAATAGQIFGDPLKMPLGYTDAILLVVTLLSVSSVSLYTYAFMHM